MPFVNSVRGTFGPQSRLKRTGSLFDITGGSISTGGGYRIHAFTTIGLSTFDASVIPSSSSAEMFVWGAGGGGGNAGGWSFGAPAGGGGSAQGSFTLTPNTYQIMVGANGQYSSQNSSPTTRACCARNQGGGAPSKATDGDNRYGGSGGGLSGIFKGSYDVAGAVVSAGGGGGGGSSRAGTGNVGGAGGGTNGADGSAPYDGQSERRGRGGSQTGSTQPLSGQDPNFQPGQLLGGCIDGYGGGGGGGWWGGSGGTYTEDDTMGGGGGGSGYLKSGEASGTLYTGSGQTPGNSGGTYRSSYGYNAGDGGGVSGDGNRGLVVIRYLIQQSKYPMILKTNEHIFTTSKKEDCVSKRILIKHTSDLPPSSRWDYQKEMTIDDVVFWEVIHEECGGISAYAAITPYAEFYMIHFGFDIEKNHGVRLRTYVEHPKPNDVEVFYGKWAQKKLISRLEYFGIAVYPKEVWVDQQDVWFYE